MGRLRYTGLDATSVLIEYGQNHVEAAVVSIRGVEAS